MTWVSSGTPTEVEGEVTYSIKIRTRAEQQVFEVMMKALDIVSHRDSERGEVWRQSGLKGQIFNVQAKAERAFRQLFQGGIIPNQDHLLDLINYAAFAAIMIKESTEPGSNHDEIKNGNWPW